MNSDLTVRISFGPCKLKFQELICIYRNSTTTINIPSRLLQLLLQLRMHGGGKQCCLAGCINDAGSYPLTACRGSYEAIEHYSWDRDNHMNYEMGEIAYIPCCSCQVNIKVCPAIWLFTPHVQLLEQYISCYVQQQRQCDFY